MIVKPFGILSSSYELNERGRAVYQTFWGINILLPVLLYLYTRSSGASRSGVFAIVIVYMAGTTILLFEALRGATKLTSEDVRTRKAPVQPVCHPPLRRKVSFLLLMATSAAVVTFYVQKYFLLCVFVAAWASAHGPASRSHLNMYISFAVFVATPILIFGWSVSKVRLLYRAGHLKTASCLVFLPILGAAVQWVRHANGL